MTKKAVFNRRVAQQLCQQGFKIVEIQPNSNKPWLNVYYFERTPALLASFDKILAVK